MAYHSQRMLDDTWIITIRVKLKLVAEGFKYKNTSHLLMLFLGIGLVLFYINKLPLNA